MGPGDWNYVTLPSADLGALQSIAVQHDSQGDGSDWFLDKITVETFRGIMVQAVFNCWIGSNQPVTKPLTEIALGPET